MICHLATMLGLTLTPAPGQTTTRPECLRFTKEHVIKSLGLIAATLLMLAVGDAQSAQSSESKEAAGRFAVEFLSNRLSIAPDSIKVVHVAIMDWPDSSLGCSRPGVEYLQVVTRGSLVLLHANNKAYRVHTGNNRAIVCDVPLRGELPRGPGAFPGMPVRNLMRLAQEDLANRLGVALADVSIAGVQTVVWPNSALGCPEPKQDYAESEVRGYRITLDHNGRIFQYHADHQRVIPCPAIELE